MVSAPSAKMVSAACAVWIALSSFAVVDAQLVGDVVVDTSNGPIRGERFEAYNAFHGVRYAQAPVGGLRFSPPVRPERDGSTIVNATAEAPGCPQTCVLPELMCPRITSEDCLFLDIFTPPAASYTAATPLPVVVFVPGGAFLQGSLTPAYDGRFLAERHGMVVVTMQYRLGALGFLATENGDTNFGVLDQRMALEWVRDNVAAFGGDPSRVTFAGESAGASSVAVHMASPGSKGLFQRAIIESNPFGLPYGRADGSDAAAARRKFYRRLGCSDVLCAKSKPVVDIVAASDDVQLIPNPLKTPVAAFLAWKPLIDGVIVADEAVASFARGEVVDIPVLMGTNTDEGDSFVRLVLKKTIYTPIYTAGLAFLFGSQSPKVLADYPPSWSIRGDKNRAALSQIATDFIFACPTRKAARGIMTAGRSSPVYLYHFDYVLDFSPSPWGSRYSWCNSLVCHGSELPFWFGSASLAGYSNSRAGVSVSADMMALWARFITSSDASPGATAAGVTWPRADSAGSSGPAYLKINVQSSVEKDYRGSYCDMWDTTGEY